LRERSIGIALFNRPATYDTADDAIVRVTASDVRKRLLQHYGNGGAESRIRVSLPPGSYVPEFSLLPELAPPLDPPVMAPELPESAPARRRRWRMWLVPSAAVLAVALALFWWSAGSRAANENVVLSAFQGSGRSAQVIVADDALVLIQVLLERRFTLDEYENLTYLNVPELAQKKDLVRFWRSLSTRQITNVGDLQNANRIAAVLQARGWEAGIRQARQMHARSFRTGNFIILGSSVSNPWADLFPVNESNFPYADLPRPGLPEIILNRQPRKGEPARFEVQVDAKTGKKTTYSRVTLLENTGHSGRVLLVAGQSMSATEMSGEWLLRDGSAAQVRQMLGLRPGSALPPLEMVLRVSEQNEVGDSVVLAACKIVSPGP
jgi:hypothetical protein